MTPDPPPTTLQIIRRTWPNPSTPGNEVPLLVDRLTLAKRRWQATAADGTVFGFDLETPLHHRDVFFENATTQYFIAQKPEPILEIGLSGVQTAAYIAWSVGNLHFPIQIAGKAIRVMDDSAVRLFLERNDISFTSRTTVFHPIQVSSAHVHAH